MTALATPLQNRLHFTGEIRSRPHRRRGAGKKQRRNPTIRQAICTGLHVRSRFPALLTIQAFCKRRSECARQRWARLELGGSRALMDWQPAKHTRHAKERGCETVFVTCFSVFGVFRGPIHLQRHPLSMEPGSVRKPPNARSRQSFGKAPAAAFTARSANSSFRIIGRFGRRLAAAKRSARPHSKTLRGVAGVSECRQVSDCGLADRLLARKRLYNRTHSSRFAWRPCRRATLAIVSNSMN